MSKNATQDFLELLKFSSTVGDPSTALGNAIYGINHNLEALPLKAARNRAGYTFFTRPQLCLADDNLRHSRFFLHLLDTRQNSIKRFVRTTLDPRLDGLSTGIKYKKVGDEAGSVAEFVKGPASPVFVDNANIFIPLLTNALKSISGFPDPTTPSYTSSENIRGGQWGIVDGHLDIYRKYSLSCTFDEFYGFPVTELFSYWITYQAEVFANTGMQPYPDFIAYNEIDYNTRIYRLIMDNTNTRVNMIYACGAAYPNSIDLGQMFNYNKENPYSSDITEVNVTIECFGAMYNDPILIDEFNKATTIGVPSLNAARLDQLKSLRTDDKRYNGYVKIPNSLKNYFNFRGYPLINPNTMELEWYVNENSATYRQVKEILQNSKRTKNNWEEYTRAQGERNNTLRERALRT